MVDDDDEPKSSSVIFLWHVCLKHLSTSSHLINILLAIFVCMRAPTPTPNPMKKARRDGWNGGEEGGR